MLIAPECYYENELKGRSVEEITREIQKLRSETNELKEDMEDPTTWETLEIMPSRAVRIHIYRQYLERAGEALEEAGGIYHPTPTEIEAENFDRLLSSSEKIILTREDSQGIHETRSVDLRGDKPSLLIQRRDASNQVIAAKETLTKRKEEFLDQLSELHIGEWKDAYHQASSAGGNSWNLEIHFAGDHPRLTKSGQDAQPYNFRKFLTLMGGKRSPDLAGPGVHYSLH